MRIVPIAWKFFALSLFFFILFLVLGWTPAAAMFLLIGSWTLYFFRDPTRIPPEGEGNVVSPADGKVDTIEVVDYAGFPDGKAIKVGIFLSIFDVHINRAPLKGRVAEMKYQHGSFLNAMNKDSSFQNENNLIVFETEQGPIQVKQIAGMIARRIICSLKQGENVERGEKIGLICFGSRTEIFLPTGAQLNVSCGMKVYGGTSILAVLLPKRF
ncbi:phosphatidylserine decarboxylase family protein [Candidatus Sumerlaeota bacterium]|nr:phosphatidylserine decarboxylase family protein [Candidatus Sumerlaeota bacterium]